jgi:hypothetical protein
MDDASDRAHVDTVLVVPYVLAYLDKYIQYLEDVTKAIHIVIASKAGEELVRTSRYPTLLLSLKEGD